MSEALELAIFNMVAKVGIDATISILDGMKNAKTKEDAIEALKKSKTWEQLKAE